MSLEKIESPIPVSELQDEQVAELQQLLSIIGYPIGSIDGLIGPKTKTAWASFKSDVVEGKQDFIGPISIKALKDSAGKIWPSHHSFPEGEVMKKDETIKAICERCKLIGLGLPEQMAYVLATVEWETAKAFKPVKEAFWKDENWRKLHLRYYPYYGRGYVQLTWENNYKAYSDIIGIDLVNNPDKALDVNISLFVLVHGFKVGKFTGHKLSEYINEVKKDYINARRCINGMDHAADIANMAATYLKKL